jgi:3-oxoacyl-[acyl-carrier protein] reductase
VARVQFDFGGKTIIVTGAGQGIGFELARNFRLAGGDVWMVDVDGEVLEAAAAAVGGHAAVGDVSNTADVDRVVADVIAATGRLDVLVNNAGILRDGVVWKLSDEDWELVLAVHLGGTFRFTRACIPHFRAGGSGRIINVTSYSGLRGNTGQANYAAAKAGIVGFTKTVAKEVARFDITVNAISPNAQTRMVAAIPEDKLRELAEVTIPMKRFAKPSEMWPAVGFLASDEAAYITGVVLPVDGGASM